MTEQRTAGPDDAACCCCWLLLLWLLLAVASSRLVDQALALFGPRTSVTGLVSNQRHLPVCSIPDAFSITLKHDRPEGPLSVVLHSSSLCKIPGPRFALHGTQVCAVTGRVGCVSWGRAGSAGELLMSFCCAFAPHRR